MRGEILFSNFFLLIFPIDSNLFCFNFGNDKLKFEYQIVLTSRIYRKIYQRICLVAVLKFTCKYWQYLVRWWPIVKMMCEVLCKFLFEFSWIFIVILWLLLFYYTIWLKIFGKRAIFFFSVKWKWLFYKNRISAWFCSGVFYLTFILFYFIQFFFAWYCMYKVQRGLLLAYKLIISSYKFNSWRSISQEKLAAIQCLS